MGKKLVLSFIAMAGVAYMLYVPFPDACDYPWRIKVMYSALEAMKLVGAFNVMSGGSFATPFKLGDFRGTHARDMSGVMTVETELGGVPVMIYRPKGFAEKALGSAMLYFHGGGWTIGSVASYSPQTAKFARKTGMLVVVPEYRLAPDHPFPAAFEDCLKVTEEFLKKAKDFDVNSKKIVISGDSAGGNLAAAVALDIGNRERDKPNPICMTNLIYPVLQVANFRQISYLQNANGPFLSRELSARFLLNNLGLGNRTELIPLLLKNAHMKGFKNTKALDRMSGKWVPEKYKRRPSVVENNLVITEDAVESFVPYGVDIQELVTNPKLAPLSADDTLLKHLPNTHIIACEYDVLRDDAIILHERMKRLGLKVSFENWEFGAHGIITAYGVNEFNTLHKAVDQMVDVIRKNIEDC